MVTTLMPSRTKQKPAESETPYKKAFERRVADDLVNAVPDWLGVLRQQAFARFEALGWPNPRKDEAWKYFPVRTVTGTPYDIADHIETILKRTEILPHLLPAAVQSHLVLVDGIVVPELSSVKLPEGVLFADFNSALETHGDVIRQHLAKNIGEESSAFTALNTALFADGVVLVLPKDTVLSQPLQVLLVTTGGNQPKAVYSRLLVIAQENSKADVLVQAVGLNAGQRLNHMVHEIYAAENAKVDVTFFRRANAFMHQMAATHVWQQAKSEVSMATIALDGMPGPVVDRHSVTVDLLGEQASCVLNGLTVLSGTTEVYNHTVINHRVPNCKSGQVYKNILDEQAKGEFFGTIVVDKGADGTDSKQLNKTLLLSDEARMWTRPQLQISADDVKCAHGAAIGQLDPAQLFYLKSRGIDEYLATCVLMYGFAEEVVQKISDPAIRKYLDALLLTSLNHAQNPLACDHVCQTCEIE